MRWIVRKYVERVIEAFQSVQLVRNSLMFEYSCDSLGHLEGHINVFVTVKQKGRRIGWRHEAFRIVGGESFRVGIGIRNRPLSARPEAILPAIDIKGVSRGRWALR